MASPFDGFWVNTRQQKTGECYIREIKTKRQDTKNVSSITGLRPTYLNSSSVSNFLGFLGQQSQRKWLPKRVAGASLDSVIAGCVDSLRTGGFVSRGHWVGCVLDGAIDAAGLGIGWADFIYAGCEVRSSGDCRSKEEMLVILLPATESATDDAYEPCLTLDAVDETDPCLG